MATNRRTDKVAKNAITNDLKVVAVKDFCKEKGFIEIANEVRENVNGYPYITFINKENEAENIYFSKAEAENHAEGDPIETGFFDELSIAYTENAEGEERLKICGKGESNRVSLADLWD